MAVEDIYLVQANFEAPSGAASYGLHYKQEVINDFLTGPGPSVLAKTWAFNLKTLAINMLSDDWWLASVSCRQVYSDSGPVGKDPSYQHSVTAQTGTRTGPSLPANDTAFCGLLQATFPARHNGGIFIPGIAEGDTLISNFTNGFLAGVFSDFRNGLITELAEESGGSGRWRVGVINGTVLDAAPPAKDWAGAFAEAQSATISQIVGGQRRRTTKVRGKVL